MPADSEMHRIRLSAGSGPTFGVDDLACAAASRLGCWEEHGLTVEWTPARGGMAAMRMVLDGEVDAAYGGLGPMLRLRAQGEPVRIVASMARALAQNLVVQPHLRETAQIEGASWAVDGIDALSHHMARCITAALGVADADVDWQVLGPPPERIAGLLAGTVDASLIRVEEAMALTGDPSNDLHMLLDFTALKALVPVQPHGVLATTEAYEKAHPETLRRLALGIVAASRRLHDSFDDFLAVYAHHVSVSLAPAQIRDIWEQEVRSNGFAVDGEMGAEHWTNQIDSFARLDPDLPRVVRSDILADGFVAAALSRLGPHAGSGA